MRRTWIAFGLVIASTAPCAAQVITGESTYEDNFIHKPPADDPPPRAARDAETRAGTGAKADMPPPRDQGAAAPPH